MPQGPTIAERIDALVIECQGKQSFTQQQLEAAEAVIQELSKLRNGKANQTQTRVAYHRARFELALPELCMLAEVRSSSDFFKEKDLAKAQAELLGSDVYRARVKEIYENAHRELGWIAKIDLSPLRKELEEKQLAVQQARTPEEASAAEKAHKNLQNFINAVTQAQTLTKGNPEKYDIEKRLAPPPPPTLEQVATGLMCVRDALAANPEAAAQLAEMQQQLEGGGKLSPQDFSSPMPLALIAPKAPAALFSPAPAANNMLTNVVQLVLGLIFAMLMQQLLSSALGDVPSIKGLPSP